MSAADIAALATGITGVIGAITALVVAIGHILHHDAPPTDTPAGADAAGPPAQR